MQTKKIHDCVDRLEKALGLTLALNEGRSRYSRDLFAIVECNNDQPCDRETIVHCCSPPTADRTKVETRHIFSQLGLFDYLKI